MPWSGLLDLSPFILVPFILPAIVLSPHHPFMLSRCILLPPIHVSLIITFHILSLSVYLTYHHPFILSPFTLPRIVLSPVISSSCLSLSLHLLSHYPFILSRDLVVANVFWPCAECGQKLFDFCCCWVAKLGYIIVLLRVLVLVHPSYWKSHIPQQGTREDSNPKGGDPPAPLKRNSVLLAPKISETVTGPIQQINCTKVHKTQLASATFRHMNIVQAS